MSEYAARRPWCLPCREADGSRTHAQYLGVACEWHWGILSAADRAAMEAAFREHGIGLRGGHVRRVLDQVWIVRYYLRQQRPPNTVEATWRADAAQLEADRA